MLVRANLGRLCKSCTFEGSVSAWRINYSVGQGGRNANDDVLVIQELLNLISPEDGGPAVPLDEDGFIGPKTNAAILGFQKFQKTASDGRVDPNGPTLKRMNEVSKQKLAQINAARLARTARSMPDLKAMATKGRDNTTKAMDYLRFGDGSFAGLGSKRAYELADLHFAFKNQSKNMTLSELAFIRTTFNRVRTVLLSRPSGSTGGDPFGISIFTIDPLGKPYSAYSPKQSFDDQRRHPDVHSGRLYLCRGIDSKVPDLFTHILLHELVHFVDDESKERQITDHGYREDAMKLPHGQRMHNSDNYALYASHIHFGRARLVGSQPALKPHIPNNL